MTFGLQTSAEEAARMTAYFVSHPVHASSGQSVQRELDTAHLYCMGASERITGDLLRTHAEDSVVCATKVNPWRDGDYMRAHPGGLSAPLIEAQFKESLERLGRTRVQLLYLHAPDNGTPLVSTLAAVDAMHRRGLFDELGLSNYAAWQVAEAVEICRRYQFITPTVYQGMYNAITRQVEEELFPCLRHYGLRFYAYNPLAGGLLTGKHRPDQAIPTAGRFSNMHYRDRFFKSSFFESMELITERCDQSGIKPAAAALRWLRHHSALSSEDGIIVGASGQTHLVQNLDALDQGPLPESLRTVFDEAW
eukprot:CAMPEP_0174238330 /NCGR_PEP_ID=MMETSP0417-20130205/11015_1 /TAXON_ID=242541 /ORGANISM="Mayorella sp, Strain BSH-02190019" /LENGTH=306 /DNA_ID=CAMNT_0015317155 /DNA_START=171 /DNA_END=1088 /DNA_ORIENTATION=+